MSHDPLCRRAKIMELLMEGCPECDLIARARADERTSILNAAVEALKALPPARIEWMGETSFGETVFRDLAVTAVEKLSNTNLAVELENEGK